MHAYRDMRHADDAALQEMQAAAKNLLDAYERFLGGDLVEGLCRLREAAKAEADRRSRGAVPTELAARRRAAG
jgi:hypothetical protein